MIMPLTRASSEDLDLAERVEEHLFHAAGRSSFENIKETFIKQTQNYYYTSG